MTQFFQTLTFTFAVYFTICFICKWLYYFIFTMFDKINNHKSHINVPENPTFLLIMSCILWGLFYYLIT